MQSFMVPAPGMVAQRFFNKAGGAGGLAATIEPCPLDICRANDFLPLGFVIDLGIDAELLPGRHFGRHAQHHRQRRLVAGKDITFGLRADTARADDAENITGPGRCAE